MGVEQNISEHLDGASAAAYGLPTASAESMGMSEERLSDIRTEIQSFVDKGKVAGLITAVARDGKVVHFETIGSMDVERDKAMRADAIFRMYSMTKPLTGVAIMMLVEEGKLDVSDPVSKYIPEFADMEVLVVEDDGSTRKVPAERAITIKHLLMHTAGLSYAFIIGPVGKLYANGGLGATRDGNLTLEEFAAKAAAFPLMAQPGTEWNYSIAMDILGRVAEVISGQRFGAFMEARIFGPLGMSDSGFHVPAEKLKRFAANYQRNEETGQRELADDPETSPYLNVPDMDSGGGGMVGTAGDYLRFAQMLLNGGELDGVRVLKEESVAEMTRNHFGPEFGEAPLAAIVPVGAEGVGFGYCGAVPMEGARGSGFVGSGQYSWAGAASTDFWIDKEQKLVGMVLTQVMPGGRYPTRRVMYNATYRAIKERY